MIFSVSRPFPRPIPFSSASFLPLWFVLIFRKRVPTLFWMYPMHSKELNESHFVVDLMFNINCCPTIRTSTYHQYKWHEQITIYYKIKVTRDSFSRIFFCQTFLRNILCRWCNSQWCWRCNVCWYCLNVLDRVIELCSN